MKRGKNLVLIGILVMLVLAVGSVIAAASMLIPAAEQAKENARAPENSPVINDGWELERIDFIHYAKPPCNNNGICEPELGENPSCADCKNGGEPKLPKCYKLLGVKWKSLPTGYTINPTNPDNLSFGFVDSAISTSAETWDDATSTELFWNLRIIDYNAQYGIQDYQNVIAFGDYPEEGVIGVTTVWYIPRGRQIVEFDILFDTDFTWGDATNPPTEQVCTNWELKCIKWNPSNYTGELWCLEWGEEVCVNWETITLEVMDLQNIATHEFGHGVGLGDIYTESCSEVTMYGYSEYNEVKKRTLEQPDITGIQKLYGA